LISSFRTSLTSKMVRVPAGMRLARCKSTRLNRQTRFFQNSAYQYWQNSDASPGSDSKETARPGRCARRYHRPASMGSL